jgi:DNA-binding beta-propeller fold protein YncE
MKAKNLSPIVLPFERTSWFIGGVLSVAFLLTIQSSSAQIMLSGNENKIDLDPGAAVVVRDAQPDSISKLDFSTFPPKVEHFMDIPNSVIGPPSNIAITPNGKLALIANSLKINPQNTSEWIPESYIHLMDLTASTPKIVGRISTQAQPSGISITPDGKMALVANRAAGTITSIKLDSTNNSERATVIEHVQVCEPELSISDVAIGPKGSTVLASIQKGGYLAELKLENGTLTSTERKFSVYGQPYRVVITPDSRFGITAGAGSGDPIDPDALTVIDLQKNPPTVIDHITIDPVTESLEVSPDGKLIAAVCMSGSNLPAGDSNRTESGSMVILKRNRKGYEVSQRLPTGRIPEGVAFTSDGKYIAVQCHPAQEIWVYRVRGTKVKDTGHRVKTPGFPSSLRAATP